MDETLRNFLIITLGVGIPLIMSGIIATIFENKENKQNFTFVK